MPFEKGHKPMGGRPKGSTKKPVIADFITEKEVKLLVEMAKDQAVDKPELLKFLLEQVFGKATQRIATDDDSPLVVKVINYGSNYTVPISTSVISTELSTSTTEIQNSSVEQEGWEVQDGTQRTN